jgi:trk system potassium uptake protein TrkA
VKSLQEASGARVAFIMRMGTAVLPDPRTVLQADDDVWVAARSGTVSDVSSVANREPEDEE